MRVVYVLLNCLLLSNAFNVDVPSFIMHSSPRDGSMFGFSVAIYSHRNSSSLLIGAPTFNTNQPGVVNGGAVLHCDSGYSGSCNYVPFDIKGDASVLGIRSDSKSNQFFGATVRTSKLNDVVVACAPRYVWYTKSLNKRDPVGTCFVARNGLTDFEEFSPCRNDHWGYHRQGFCQAGFDAALTTNGDRLYIGAPGAYYWQGQVHSQQLGGRNEHLSSGESAAHDDDQYLGYSVATGDFDGDGTEDVALGVPKGLNYTGKIALYSQDLRWIQNITGDQLGSYFGYCLTVLDFNGDGLDDIIVGSPMYTNYQDRQMKIEVGRVHVLIQSARSTFHADVIYTGEVHKGRFGLSVASLGDINLDGYGDVAVGAPYGGADSRGAVFIYHGFSTQSYSGQDTIKASQVLYAADVGHKVTTFGWSLSGGVDTDNNQYPDLLVGAYEADKAFLFRSRPIVKFYDFEIAFLAEGKTVDIEAKNCDIPRGDDFTCLEIEFCLAYNGVNVHDQIELELTYTLDTKHTSEVRLLFQSNEDRVFTERVRYDKEQRKCRKMQTFIVPGLTDKLTPITAEVSYTLIQQTTSVRSLTPVLNLGQQLSVHDSVTIQNNCGEDNVCIPDLSLTVEAPDQFIIGQKEMMSVDVKVVNRGEDAFEAVVYITEPPGLLFNKFVQPPNSTLTLSTNKINGTSFIKVDVGNPLAMNQQAAFSVKFQQSQTVVQPSFEFLVTANSTNTEASGSQDDNVIRKVVQAKIDAQLTLFGSSDPELLVYNVTQYQVPFRSHESHIGPSLIHKYGLLNKGPSDTEEVDIVILWPSRTLEGKHLLYLMEQPITIGNVECDEVPDINPLQYTTLGRASRAKLLGLNSLDSSRSSSSSSSSVVSSSGNEYTSTSKTEYSSSSSQSSSSGSSGGGAYSGADRSGYASGTSGSAASSADGEYSSSGSREYSSSSGGSAGGSGYSGSSGNQEYSSSGNREYSSSSGGSAGGSGYSGNREYSSSGNREYSSSSGGSVSSGSAGGSGYTGSSENREYSSSGNREYSSSSGGSVSSGYAGDRTSLGSSGGQTYSTPGGGEGYSGVAGRDGYSGGGRNTETYGQTRHQSSSTEREYKSSGSGGQAGYHTGQREHSSSSSGFGSDQTGHSTQNGRGEYSGSSGQAGQEANSAQRQYSSSSGGYGSGQARTYDLLGQGSYGGSGARSGSGAESVYESSSSSQREHSSSSDSYDSSGRNDFAVQGADYRGSFRPSEPPENDGYSESSKSSTTYNPDGSVQKTSSSSRTYSSSSSDGSYQGRSPVNYRTKRNDVQDEWYRLTTECGATSCTRIQCRVRRLKENEDVYIYLRSRLYIKTITEDDEYKFPVDDVYMSTRMATRTRISAQGVSEDIVKVDSKDIRTQIKSAKSLQEAPAVPWWVWLLAILAGILILVILILILYKLGFFERQRPK